MKHFIALIALLVSTLAFADTRVVTLSIPDMNCASCPVTVKKGLEKVEGITIDAIDLETKTARITINDPAVTDTQLVEATRNVGYPSSVIKE